ncbi:MAG: TolC family protein [Rickettsiales bacterium TMED289]|nr:MAG: TolC family protein [Rickettsiales bacterium TMED289]
MKFLITIFFIFIFNINHALSDNLYDALKITHKNNKELNAERENVNIAEQDLKISKGNYLPTGSISGSKSRQDTNKLTNQSGGDASINDVDPTNTTIKLEQTLIDFGRNAELRKSQLGLNLAKEKLKKAEQEIFYKAIESYSNLIASIEKVDINEKNLNLLIRQVENDKTRLEIGQITLSDLSQSESSLAGAQAKNIKAINDLTTSKLYYENVIGKINNLDDLNKSLNPISPLPKSLNEAIELSKNNNPDIIISKIEHEQSEKDIKISKSDLAPTATLSIERSNTQDFSSTIDEKEQDTIKATITWPFFSGGKNLAKLNKNQSERTRKRLLLDNTIKSSETSVSSAWSNYQSSESILQSIRAQVNAAEIANEGIVEEYQRGSRSTLDFIQSTAILLDARISLADSERDFVLAQYNLLKSVGLLHSDYLNVK